MAKVSKLNKSRLRRLAEANEVNPHLKRRLRSTNTRATKNTCQSNKPHLICNFENQDTEKRNHFDRNSHLQICREKKKISIENKEQKRKQRQTAAYASVARRRLNALLYNDVQQQHQNTLRITSSLSPEKVLATKRQAHMSDAGLGYINNLVKLTFDTPLSSK